MIIYGINPLMEALHAPRPVIRVYIGEGKDNARIRAIRRYAEERDVPVESARNLDHMADTDRHQGVAAEIPSPVHEELPWEPLQSEDRWVIFDSLRDPHNFGAALRVCEVFGFPNVIYYEGNSSGITATAVKVSAGAVFHLNVYQSNLNRAVQRLQESGVSILALEAEGDQTIYDVELPERFCLVIGAEDEGVRHNIRRAASQILRIPVHGRVNSLNVSCALTAALTVFSRKLNG